MSGVEVHADQLAEDYDLIVIGSGPAGHTLSMEYAEKRPMDRILVVESGSRAGASDAQRLAKVQATGDLAARYYPNHNQRRFGGTSMVWNGWCTPLEKAPFLRGEWPFPYEELAAQYPKAAEILQLPKRAVEKPEVPFEENPNVLYRPYYFSPPTRFGVDGPAQRMLDHRSVGILFSHTVTSLVMEGGAVKGVRVRSFASPSSPPLWVTAPRVVVACGGVQNARLLQLSLPGGGLPGRGLPGSGLPALGQCFAEHPHLYGAASIELDHERWLEMCDSGSDRVSHSLALSSEYAHRHGLQMVTLQLPGRTGDPQAANLMGRRRMVLRARVNIRAEMPPSAKNRVSLVRSRKDLFDQSMAAIHLEFSRAEIRESLVHLSRELARAGLGHVGGLPDSVGVTGGGHMMGTTRMGTDDKTSVTDSKGKVHGVDGLYVAGSSLFPSTGSANPTLTIVALALRLANHLTGQEHP